MVRAEYARGVFINCPFDAHYKPLFESIVFAVFACGFRPRCALEIDDASEVRIDKIFKMRNWLRNASPSRVLPGGMEIYHRYQLFEQDLPALCAEIKVQRDELTFNDSASIIYDWLLNNT